MHSFPPPPLPPLSLSPLVLCSTGIESQKLKLHAKERSQNKDLRPQPGIKHGNCHTAVHQPSVPRRIILPPPVIPPSYPTFSLYPKHLKSESELPNKAKS